jgi:hypothetical protein
VILRFHVCYVGGFLQEGLGGVFSELSGPSVGVVAFAAEESLGDALLKGSRRLAPVPPDLKGAGPADPVTQHPLLELDRRISSLKKYETLFLYL